MIQRTTRNARMIGLPSTPLRAIALAGALLGTLALSSCALLGGKQADPLDVYAPNVHVVAGNDWPQVPWSLVIAPPSAPLMLDSTRILVRPTPDELQVYHGAAWSQAVPELLEGAVLGALEDSGKINAVGRQGSGIRADCKLVLDIRHFEAQYTDAGSAAPQALIEVNAKLIGNAHQDVIATRTFVRAQPAASKEIPAVAAAFEQGLNAVTADIAQWTLQNGK